MPDQPKKVRALTRAAVFAALYAVLTALSAVLNLAFGAVQLRFSEALCVLPLLFPEAAWGTAIGCFLANVISPYGPLDLLVGPAATLLAGVLTASCRRPALAPLPPVVCNAVLVGAVIAWEETGTSAAFLPAFAYHALTIGAGEALVCYALGLPLLHFLRRRAEAK